jgi:hypothetical protein
LLFAALKFVKRKVTAALNQFGLVAYLAAGGKTQSNYESGNIFDKIS